MEGLSDLYNASVDFEQRGDKDETLGNGGRIEAYNARSARLRDLYQSLGLSVVVHKDGTLEFSSSLGAPARVLPGVTPASIGVSG